MPTPDNGLHSIDHMLAFISIIVAVIATEFLIVWSRFIRTRVFADVLARQIIWSILMFLFLIQYWHSFLDDHIRTSSEIGFVLFLMFLSQPLLIHFSLAFLFPRSVDLENTSRSYFLQNESGFYLLLALIVLNSGLQDLLEEETATEVLEKSAFRLIGVALLLGAAFWTQAFFRQVVLALCCLLFLAYLASFA